MPRDERTCTLISPGRARTPVIEPWDIYKQYGNVTALSGLSLRVMSGERAR